MYFFAHHFCCALGLLILVSNLSQPRGSPAQEKSQEPRRKTAVAIHGARFFINGQPTYKDRTWKGQKIEGLLLNSRMVQAIFDDLNPDTVHLWKYPDTKSGIPSEIRANSLLLCPRGASAGLWA
jgi:hypothetical protein